MTEELVPTDASAPAVTESGRTIHEHSEKDVTDALNFLVLTASPRRAANLMRDLGHPVSERALKNWRDHSFRTRYYNIRRELAQEIGEELAGKAFERALQADEVQATMIERLGSEVAEIDAKDLPKGIQALANAKSSDIEKAQLLRDKPTSIEEKRSVTELFAELKSLNVVVNEDRSSESHPEAIPDTSATEIPSDSGTDER
jgi:hypothetical protein